MSSGRLAMIALIGGLLLWGCYYPLQFAPLAAVALVPFFMLVRSTARPRSVYLAGLLMGLSWFVPVLQWLRVAHPMMHLTWLGLSLYCSLYLVVALALTRALDRRIGNLMIAGPIVWVSLEYIRSTFGGGFAWYLMGHSVHQIIPLIQIADITGVYGISFLIVMLNAWIYESFIATPTMPSATIRRYGTVAMLGSFILVFGYGMICLQHTPFRDGPRLALVQGNLSQDIRNARNDDDEQAAQRAIVRMREHHIQLSEVASMLRPTPHLIVWPETSYPHSWVMLPPEKPASLTAQEWANVLEYRNLIALRLREMAMVWQADVMYGLNGRSFGPMDRELRWNTALHIDRTGQPLATYHKMHRVPFGEYVPFKNSLPFMKWFTPYDYDYGIEAGTEYTRFQLRGDDDERFTFGVIICYEDSDPTLARRYNAGSDPVDFLVNISNDGWFKGTSEHEQHLAICRFRAVEARRAVARSVNMGISAVIDADGRIAALPAETWSASKKIECVLPAIIPIDDRDSLYARLGDWFPIGCLLLLIVLMLRRRM